MIVNKARIVARHTVDPGILARGLEPTRIWQGRMRNAPHSGESESVKGQRSNRLNYVPTCQINEMRNRQCLCGVAQIAYSALIAFQKGTVALLSPFCPDAGVRLDFRLPRLRLASPRSSWQRRPPADMTATGPHAHRCQSQQSPRRLPCPRQGSPAQPSLLHPILQSPLRVWSPRLPAPSPARAAPWSLPEAATPPVGLGSVAESAAVAS